MVTVKQVYDMAIHLMDEQNEMTGETEGVDTQEYKFRTISILNSVIPALYPYSGNFKDKGVGRPMPRMLFADSYKEPELEQTIDLDDAICYALLPYYLASQLLSSENEELSRWFMERFQTAFFDLRNKVPAEFEPISTPYGTF